MSNSGVLDTRFRSALDRMATLGRLNAYTAPVDPHLEVAAIMKKLDGGPALLFTAVDGYDMPVVGNLLSCQANCEAAFGIDFNGIREFIGRALGSPQPPVMVEKAPAQEHVHTQGHRPRPHAARAPPHRGGCRTLRHRRDRDRARSRHRHLQRVLSSPAARGRRAAPASSSTTAGICASPSSAPSARAKPCRSPYASDRTWRCTTPPRPWARRCRSMPTRSRSRAGCAGGRSRSCAASRRTC